MSEQASITVIVSILSIAVAVGILLLLRSVTWWYFGIDKHLANQKRIIELMEQSSAKPSSARIPDQVG